VGQISGRHKIQCWGLITLLSDNPIAQGLMNAGARHITSELVKPRPNKMASHSLQQILIKQPVPVEEY